MGEAARLGVGGDLGCLHAQDVLFAGKGLVRQHLSMVCKEDGVAMGFIHVSHQGLGVAAPLYVRGPGLIR